MKTHTLDEVQDKLIGKIGTQNRDRFEYELHMDLIGQAINSANAMCFHKINIFSVDDVNQEVFDWIKKAFDAAG